MSTQKHNNKHIDKEPLIFYHKERVKEEQITYNKYLYMYK